MTTKPIVVPSLYHFMHGVVDYAGLYPPAQLPLQEAITNYYHYRRSGDCWMLAHFVIGAQRLDELAALFAEHPYLLDEGPLSFAVVGQGGLTEEDFLENLREDAAAIHLFSETFANQANVAQYEVKLPLLGDAAAVAQLAHNAQAVLNLPTFYELTLGQNWAENVRMAVAGLAEAGNGVGAKLRTGGLVAEAIPTVQQVAHVLITCRDAGVPLKCTAGLHHPVRQYQAEVSAKMHGFVNVFGAAMLAQSEKFSPSQLSLVLDEEQPDRFKFDERGFHWHVYEVKADEVAAARQSAIISFGSCSFDDPRTELRQLGWL